MDKNHQNTINDTNGYTAINSLFVNSINKLENVKPTKKINQRNDLLNQIYAFYNSEQETIHIKRANWKRYIQELKKHSWKDNKEHQEHFKKSKLFIKKKTPRDIAFFLSHIPTNDLWYILSVVKDKTFRNESVGAYIMGLTIKS